MVTTRRLLISISTALALLGGALAYGLTTSEAAVGVTAATGGGAISADTAANAATPAWTSLGAITITEGLATDFAVGAGVTLILTAPTGFEFNTAQVPDVTGITTDLTSVAMSYPTTTTMQLLYTSAFTTISDVVVIGGVTAIQVRPTAGTPLASGNIVRATGNAGTGTITGVTLDVTNFGTLTSVVGAVAQLGVTTQPAGAVAGAAFTTQPAVRTEDQFASASTTGLGASLNVTATLTTGTGPLQGTAALDVGMGAGNGTVTYTNLRLDVAQAGAVLTFSAAGLTSIASGGFAVAPGAATQLAVTTQPSASTVSGVAIAQQPVVTIRDAFGNTRTGDTDTITAALTGGTGALSGTATEAAVAGVADFVGNGLAIDLVGADKVLTFTSGALTPAVSSTFTITAAVAAGATSTISAAPTSIFANGVSTSTVTVQLRDAASNALTAGGDAVVLATTTGALSIVTDVGDGTYTATLTSGVAGTATVSGTVNASAITDTAVVTLAAVPPPPAAPTPTTTTTTTMVEESGLMVAVTDETTIEVAATGGVAVAITTSGGASANVSVPEGTLPSGSTLSLSLVQDLGVLVGLAPPPAGLSLAAAFVVRAAAADGASLTSFDAPIRLEFQVADSSLPANAQNDALVVVYWNGAEWVGVPTTVSGSATRTLVAEVRHLTLFGVAHGLAQLEVEATIHGTLPAVGFGLVTFGGSIAELEAALVSAGCLAPVFTTLDGAFVGFFPTSAVALANAAFTERYAGGVPLRTPLLGGRCGA